MSRYRLFKYNWISLGAYPSFALFLLSFVLIYTTENMFFWKTYQFFAIFMFICFLMFSWSCQRMRCHDINREDFMTEWNKAKELSEGKSE